MSSRSSTVLVSVLFLMAAAASAAQHVDQPVTPEVVQASRQGGTSSGEYETTGDVGRTGGAQSSTTWDTAREMSEEVWENSKETTRDIWDQSKQTSQEIWDATKRGASKAGEYAGRAWETTKEVSKQAWDKTKDAAAATGRAAKQMYRDATGGGEK